MNWTKKDFRTVFVVGIGTGYWLSLIFWLVLGVWLKIFTFISISLVIIPISFLAIIYRQFRIIQTRGLSEER